MAPPLLLTIAGSDSGGGAGIQADLKTFSALGAFGTSVITALTAQNTRGVSGVQGVPSSFVLAQIEAVVTDLPPAATKIGMLFSTEMVRAVAEAVRYYALKPTVLDPVMVAKSGDPLLEPDAIAVLREKLLPLCSVVTPNVPEAELLVGFPIRERHDMERAAEQLSQSGTAVFLKGGHLAGSSVWDLLWRRGHTPLWFSGPRIDSSNTHGTGCTLSSALAAELAWGQDLPRAASAARAFVQGAMRGSQGWRIGNGHGPLDHGWKQR